MASPLPHGLRRAALVALVTDGRWGQDLLPLLLTCRGAQEDDELLRLLLPAAYAGRGLFGRTLLAAAARSNDLQLAQRLLDALPGSMDGREPFPLECIQLPRDSSMGFFHNTYEFGSALYLAASEGFSDMVGLLTSRGMHPAALISNELDR
jgi:hypothetical protein